MIISVGDTIVVRWIDDTLREFKVVTIAGDSYGVKVGDAIQFISKFQIVESRSSRTVLND